MRLATLRVLIVDDNANDRLMAADALRDMKLTDVDRFEVEEARMGREGIKKAQTGSYDVILLDYNLPDITGLQVLQELRAANVTTPVVAMTSAGGEDIAKQFLASGAKDYVTKNQLTEIRLGTTLRNVVFMAKLGRSLKSSAGQRAWGGSVASRTK